MSAPTDLLVGDLLLAGPGATKTGLSVLAARARELGQRQRDQS